MYKKSDFAGENKPHNGGEFCSDEEAQAAFDLGRVSPCMVTLWHHNKDSYEYK